jgi:site-specific recombinase XerD
LSINTQASYRDTLVLLLPFAADLAHLTVDKLLTDHLASATIRLFLQHLEEQRKCCVATRNQRLAAIHALARFIASKSPEHISWTTDVCSVQFKKTSKPSMCYLEKSEMDALLNAPDRSSMQGCRDYAVLLFLYNTGARANEVAQLKIGDVALGQFSSVKIIGKGNKTRHCPLWPVTTGVLESLIGTRQSSERVFLNQRKEPITRFGINSLVKRYAARAALKCVSIGAKQVSPHSVRHTCAVHLLRAGVDINTIRAWLGHVSLDTTHVYAEVDLEMKARALAHCEISTREPEKNWQKDTELMSFLKAL